MAALASVVFASKASVLGVRDEARKDVVEPFSAHPSRNPHSIFLCLILPLFRRANENREKWKVFPQRCRTHSVKALTLCLPTLPLTLNQSYANVAVFPLHTMEDMVPDPQ